MTDIPASTDDLIALLRRGSIHHFQMQAADRLKELAEALRAANDEVEALRAERTVLRGLHAGAVDACKDLRAANELPTAHEIYDWLQHRERRWVASVPAIAAILGAITDIRAEQAGNDHP